MKIKLFLNNNLISTTDLTPGQEYIAGRGAHAQIPMQADKGISRQHIKFIFENNVWNAYLVARYGALIVNNEPAEMVELFDKLEMSVPPYRFVFEDSSYEEEIQHHDSTKTQVIADTSEDYEGTEVVSSDAANKDYFTEVNQEERVVEKDSQNSDWVGAEGSSQNFSDEEYDGTEVADKNDWGAIEASSNGSEFSSNVEREPNFQSNPSSNSSFAAQSNSGKTRYDSNFQGNMDDTDAGVREFVVYVSIYYRSGEVDTLKLEGNRWLAGRDKSCAIHIHDDHASRQHFELNYQEGQLFVTDLGSSNGTAINNHKLPPHDPIMISSGEKIKIKSIQIVVELKDPKIEKRMEQMSNQLTVVGGVNNPSHNLVPITGDPSAPIVPDAYGNFPATPGVLRLPEQQKSSGLFGFIFANKVRAAMFALLILGGSMYLIKEQKPKSGTATGTSVATDQPKTGFTALDVQKQDLIKNQYQLAINQFNRGEFAFCLASLGQIEELLPTGYKQSKRYETLCRNGMDLKKDEEEQKQAFIKQQENEKIVSQTIAFCKSKINSFQTVEQAEQCLSEAILRNPAAPGIEEIRVFITQKLKAVETAESQKRAYQQRVATGQRIFDNAMRTYNSGDHKKSIGEFKSFLATSYPDPKNNKEKAKQLIESIESNITRSKASAIKECLDLESQDKPRELYKACSAALKVDPGNKEVESAILKMRSKIGAKMREIFENAILEESYGNVEDAKTLWKKILQEDFEGGSEFYEKSLLRIKKYEIR